MAIGGASGYLTVNPTEDYMGQAVQRAGESFARVRAEKMAKERDRMANEQNLQEQRRRDFKDAEEFSAKYPFVAMGNTSIDSKNRQDLETGKQKYSEAMDNYYKTGDKKYMAVADSVKASINEATEMPKALSLVVEGWQKEEANLNPSSLEKAKNILQKLKTDTVRDYDENGRAVYTIVERDASGNPTKILHNKISGEQVKELLNVEPNFDVTGEKGLISQFKKNLRKIDDKKDVVMTPKGEVLRITNGYEGYEKTAAVMAKELTQNHSAVYKALENLGLDPENKDYYTDEKVLKDVEDSYYNILVDSAKPSVSEVPYLDREKFAHTKSQDAIGNANAKKSLVLREKETGAVTVTDGETVTSYGAKVPTQRKTYKEYPNDKAPAKKEIKRSDIASKAKAAGYSVKEYEALLIKNGVTIK